MEIAEEEALYHRMVQDALMNEAKNQQMTQNDSVQNVISQNDTSAQGGMIPFSIIQNVTEQPDFTWSPIPVVGKMPASFINLTLDPTDDTFLWTFGSGSTTSTDINPTFTYNQTGSYTVTLYETSSGQSKSSIAKSVLVVVPTLGVSFSGSTFGLTPNGFTASFTASITNNGAGTFLAMWVFGDGNVFNFSSSMSNTTIYTYSSLAIFTASLQVTESSFLVTQSVTEYVDPFLGRIVAF